MEVPEGLDFIRQLMEHATQRQFVYRHKWTTGDLGSLLLPHSLFRTE